MESKKKKLKTKKQRGITLIALVVTIVVLLILASVSITVVFGDNGILSQTQKAKNETQKAENEEEKNLDKLQVELSKYDGTTIGRTQDNRNRTLSGKTDGYTFKNPIIPKGFIASDDGAAWYYTDDSLTEVKGWNDGLVIENNNGDQFVWVPCSINDSNDVVKYEERFNEFRITVTSDIKDGSVDNDAVPVNNEITQITNYEGFYVARYEAGRNEDEIPKSEYGIKVWSNVNYIDAVNLAKSMINNESKYGATKSGLITATQWDTIMTWYEKSGIGIRGTDQKWGSCYDLNYSINGYYFTEDNGSYSSWSEGLKSHISNEGPKLFHASGLNDNGYNKNIADLAGNLWEWTAETYWEEGDWHEWAYRRGGSAWDVTSTCPITRMSLNEKYDTDNNRGFRVVLYVE